MMTFTAYVEWDPETSLYVGIVPGIPGAHTQAASLDELQKNLKEVTVVKDRALIERGNRERQFITGDSNQAAIVILFMCRVWSPRRHNKLPWDRCLLTGRR